MVALQVAWYLDACFPFKVTFQFTISTFRVAIQRNISAGNLSRFNSLFMWDFSVYCSFLLLILKVIYKKLHSIRNHSWASLRSRLDPLLSFIWNKPNWSIIWSIIMLRIFRIWICIYMFFLHLCNDIMRIMRSNIIFKAITLLPALVLFLILWQFRPKIVIVIFVS